MTRILYWNIENFGINKIQNPRTKRQKGARYTQDESSADRLGYILDHIHETTPDIFILVEVETPYNDNRGTMCGGDGNLGLLELLDIFRTLNADWCLVPPLITGNKESVGVFYRHTQVTFTGPNWWSGGFGPTVAVAAAGAAAYPPPWNNCLPAGNYRAAKVQFASAVAPGNVDFGDGTRHPYQTTFTDGAGRTLNIYSVHAPANYFGATNFLTHISNIQEFSVAPPANEVQLVLGDFNLSLLSVFTDTYNNCYHALTGLGSPFTVALNPLPAAPVPLEGYRGYYATHMVPRTSGRCWSTVGENAFYPGYYYTGSTDIHGNYTTANDSIDNILYRALPGTVIAPQLTIINGLVASPYDNATPPAGANPGGACPQGVQAFAQAINWSWAGLNPQWAALRAPNTAPQFAAARGVRGWFQGWDVYGKIRSTSDHLPLFFVI